MVWYWKTMSLCVQRWSFGSMWISCIIIALGCIICTKCGLGFQFEWHLIPYTCHLHKFSDFLFNISWLFFGKDIFRIWHNNADADIFCIAFDTLTSVLLFGWHLSNSLANIVADPIKFSSKMEWFLQFEHYLATVDIINIIGVFRSQWNQRWHFTLQ